MRIASIAMIIALLFQVGVKTGVMIWFEANQTVISQTLCENRARPMLNCNGKCVLAKKLKKAEQKRQNERAPISEIDNEVSPTILENEGAEQDVSEQMIFGIPYLDRYSFIQTKSVFHPPQYLV